MVKVTLVSNNPRINKIVSENMTVRQLLEENNIVYSNASVAVDGIPLSLGDMDKSLMEHGITEKCIVSAMPNKDCAAQAVVMGSACIVKSTLKPEEIRTLKKLHPEELVMTDEDGDPVFAIDIDEGIPGTINSNGACFGNSTSENGNATITVLLDPETEDPVGMVYEKLGKALVNLDKMEKQLAEKIPELQEEERRVRSMISRI